MKYIFSIALFSMLSFSVLAQEAVVKNSSLFLGGSFNFLTQNNTYPFNTITFIPSIGGVFSNSEDDITYTSFSLNPYLGKEVNENLSIGLQVNLRFSKWKNEDAIINIFEPDISGIYERNNTQLGLAAFARFHFNPDGKLKPFVQAFVGYENLKEEQGFVTEELTEETANFFQAGALIGALYNFSEKFSFRLGLGGLSYVNGSWKNSGANTENDFSSFNADFRLSSFSLGLEMKL